MDSRTEDLEKRINDLRKRLPAHSARPWMLEELEELEEELAALKAKAAGQHPGGK